MLQPKLTWPPEALILVGPSFDEVAIVYSLFELRQRGLSAATVGTSTGLVSSACGLLIYPDATLDDDKLLAAGSRQLLILSGGAECAATILSDPRAHRLVQALLSAGGHVAALAHTYQLFIETGLLLPQTAGRFWRQDGMNIVTFMNELIRRL